VVGADGPPKGLSIFLGVNVQLSRDFKGVWFPREIWLNKNLSMIEKAVLIEVDSLDQGEEHCFASNEYLSEFVGCSIDTISRAVQKLVEEGFLTVETSHTREGSKRVLTSCLAVRKIRRPPPQNQETPAPQNAEHNNTLPLRDLNNTNEFTLTPEQPKRRKPKPSRPTNPDIRTYGTNGHVRLTLEEGDKFLAMGYTAPQLDEAIEFLDDWIEDKGKDTSKSKSGTHFYTLKRWVFAAVAERTAKAARLKQYAGAR